MNSTIFCHIRYCGQYTTLNMLQEIPIIQDYHQDWAIINILGNDHNEKDYLNHLELLL